ncbi:MrcB family domain-containing protein [Allorhizocola rhizosphaerae]|uniref:MrcB family domain-containing protein n=1 Tax=Allorhizocola rhizosphaerae TaxID=1872709 RepID=UPI000E3C7B09|nr:DUF3578 domain-containing protein [Allorhizocola rhizosphaerae]
MRLRKLIGEIGARYDRLLPMSSPAHRLLRKAEGEFEQWIPPGHLVEGSGGNDAPAITPRIAVFHRDETTTIRHGMYVAYLFAADNSTVTLTLNQGIGEMAEHLGRAGARLVLALEAATIRKALRPTDIADLDVAFDLRTTEPSSVDYQHTNIVSRTYRVDSLPGESEMVADLQRFVQLYALALQAREVARRHGRQELIIPARPAAVTIAAETAPEPQPEPPAKEAQEFAPEIGVDRKHKTLTGSMTRRGLLAALVVAPIAYVTPRAVASRDQDVVTQESVPPLPAPVFTIDVSQHDWKRRGGNLDWVGIRQAGIAGMCARATYGDPAGYQWPTHHFGDFARAARHAGLGIRGGYHNLVRGDQASINRQVDWLRAELDRHSANWAMLDVERYAELVKADMWPRWEDVRRFDDRWAEVETRVLVGYIPPWNWSKYLGQPDLREFRGPLIASNYPLKDANEDFKRLYERVGGNDGRGWAVYGSRVPEGWQYSSRAKVPGAPYICDVNAWRMSSEQLKALLLGSRHTG